MAERDVLQMDVANIGCRGINAAAACGSKAEYLEQAIRCDSGILNPLA
ncbi:hypothetical protein GPL17_36050 [Bradyrhizobium yuanmingense]|nr:hypothetical protein [Bradyrhizobium yuanmingense]